MPHFSSKSVFGKRSLHELQNDLETSNQDLFVLVDGNTKSACWPILESMLPRAPKAVLEVAPGEQTKNPATLIDLWQRLANGGANRNALLINLGGGMITDLGGFVASTYKRGISFMHVPTSLLAMVDAAYGGKTGIDVGDIKNLAGTFAPAAGIYVYPQFLKTLPKEELISGMAEMMKHGLIADKNHWLQVVNAAVDDDLEDLIHTSAQIKLGIVEQDYTETGQRKTLNFGHTLGHAVESYFLKNSTPILHGQAIACGMLMEAWLSTQKLDLDSHALIKITAAIQARFNKLALPEAADEFLLEALLHDKKNSGGQIKCVLLERIGQSKIDQTITIDEASSALNWYRKL